LVDSSVARSVGQGEVTQTSCCLFSFITQARSSRPFYALRATPKTALNFGRSVGRSQGSHTNVTLPLQFRQLGLPFPTLLCPTGHPKNGLKFWSVGRLVCRSQGSHTNVTLPLQFRHPGLTFPTLLCPAGHPQNNFKFWSVGRSRGSHTNVMLPLQFCHPGPPFPTLLCPAEHPENSL
jgi:hypothetical protein